MNLIQKIFKAWRYLSAAITFVIIAGGHCYAQERKGNADSVILNNEIDIFDVVRHWMKKPAKVVDTLSSKKKNLSILPVVGYSPSNGAILGAAVSVTKYMGDPKTTKSAWPQARARS